LAFELPASLRQLPVYSLCLSRLQPHPLVSSASAYASAHCTPCIPSGPCYTTPNHHLPFAVQSCLDRSFGCRLDLDCRLERILALQPFTIRSQPSARIVTQKGPLPIVPCPVLRRCRSSLCDLDHLLPVALSSCAAAATSAFERRPSHTRPQAHSHVPGTVDRQRARTALHVALTATASSTRLQVRTLYDIHSCHLVWSSTLEVDFVPVVPGYSAKFPRCYNRLQSSSLTLGSKTKSIQQLYPSRHTVFYWHSPSVSLSALV